MRRWQILILGALVGFSQSVVEVGHAQDVTTQTSSERDVLPEPDREQWLARIAEAKRRSREIALERRMRPPDIADWFADEERRATERVINDESLRSGDIVSTRKGLFEYRGRPDGERRESDFIPLPKR